MWGAMTKCERVTVRYASGAVEHWFGATLPKIGARIGRNGEAGFVTSVYASADGARVAVVLLNGSAPDGYGSELAKDTARRLFCAA